MKYYAVTDDPRELYHYGVKGMKWGQHLFGDDSRPKSPGYHKAVSKLKGIMGKTAKAAKTTAAQISYNHRQRQDRKFEKAVQRSQKRIAQIEGLHAIDMAQNYERSLSRDQNRLSKQQLFAKKAYNVEKKRELNYAKNESKMDKYLQQAREGRLKYGKLSEDQIHRIQDRLQLEAGTRRLESAEKTWKQQKKEARRKGRLSGIERGTAAAMEELARAGATYGVQHLMDRQKLKAAAKQQGKEDRLRNREKNKKTHKDIKQDLEQELYKTQIESGKGIIKRATSGMTAAQKAKTLKNLKNNNRIEEKYQKYLEDNNLTDKQAREKYNDYIKNKYGKDSEYNLPKFNKVNQMNLIMENAKERQAEKDKQKKFESDAENSRNKRYIAMLEDIGGTDKENRRAYENILSDDQRGQFRLLTEDQQRNEVLKFYETQKKNQKLIQEAADRYNAAQKNKREQKAYEEAKKSIEDEYKDRLDEYRQDLKDWQGAYQKWVTGGSKGNPPKRPTKPQKRMLLPYDYMMNLPPFIRNTGGGNKGN